MSGNRSRMQAVKERNSERSQMVRASGNEVEQDNL